MKAEIATHQAKFTLERLHAELGGKILENKKQAARLVADMKHVEAVLKMLDPDYDVRPIGIRPASSIPGSSAGRCFATP